ncbi:DsrE/DsrF/DrsH-like family protein, partial [candidate division KSB1 bacterium]
MKSELDYEIANQPGSSLGDLRKEIQELKTQIDKQKPSNEVNIICFSGEWDRLFAALTIASGSLAMNMDVHLFFTFWSVNAIRKHVKTSSEGKSFVQKMFLRIMPCGIHRAPLSKLNCFGLSKVLLKREMKKNRIDDIDQLFEEVKELGAHIHICDTSSALFGLDCSDLNTGANTDICGVTTFLSHAFKGKM